MEPLALVIDDEPDICELLALTLQRMDVHCHTAATLREAQRLLDENRYDFCLTDIRLPDGDGLQLVEHIQAQDKSDLPVAVITAHGNMDTAIKALKLGAFDFVSKPVDLERLRSLVQLALRLNHKRTDTQKPNSDHLLLGETEKMRELRRQIAKVARSDAPIYISGESGSGKELAARSIHAQGPRADKPFVPINCGAIPAELMESEFFGHKKGSFTGAHRDKPGLMQAAEGGTLFLDEVADLPLDMQVKLLRAIQEKSVRPIGASQEVPIDVRILSATHKDLAKEVAEGRFRNDLYYRINVIEITVPPLRERKEDIPLLAQTIMQRIATNAGVSPPHLSAEAMEALKNYQFPGNVRQLENTLERAFTLSDQQIIRAPDLHLEREALSATRSAEQPTPPRPPSQPAAAQTYPGQFDPSHYGSLDSFLQAIEKEAIEKALNETRWNRTAAAQKLGISFRSLRYRLKKLGLED
ncbi:sigma-54 dependent transcriptional regulator [Microbulbifer thermotolerans]|uniref:sigma-54-dependent transcriptional regulator n=1 Tax=Microbulbifer thermotolerans TaxID=252514 RepID=UPI00224AB455|nr:sigma-54 dependent transcriptional regulator [Microbulbifer thermotolerans]MCX2780253.1 sigma-54 dependent transcriptional regulator [Microbulbifer thermotolerans]MCX2783877.1 sigma-54 dependent transcriptional regulator [Microbulbifer thermotolerans]MCX2805793.1 sigma-54 dependent transcriptional regulator [Microbulbifer thermotolerans]